MNPLTDVIIDPNNSLTTCSAILPLSGEDIFIRKGEYKGYRTTFIKFRAEKTQKISRNERVINVIAALIKTIFSLGIALFFEETRENWSKAWYGRKHAVAYIAKSEVENNETKLTVKQIVIKAIRFNGRLEDVSEKLQDDENVVLAGISYGISPTLQYASQRLRASERIVTAAVEQHGFSLQYASEELRRNKNIVLKAIKSFAGAYEFISSKELREDPEVVAAYEESKRKFNESRDRLQAAFGIGGNYFSLDDSKV